MWFVICAWFKVVNKLIFFIKPALHFLYIYSKKIFEILGSDFFIGAAPSYKIISLRFYRLACGSPEELKSAQSLNFVHLFFFLQKSEYNLVISCKYF